MEQPHDPVRREEQFLEEARQGSKEAFDELARMYYLEVRATLATRILARDLREDLATEVFLTAYRSLQTFSSPPSFGAWLAGIARNRLREHLREARQKRSDGEPSLATAVENWLEAEEASSGANAADSGRSLFALKECIGSLPAKSRQMLHSYYFDGVTPQEFSQSAVATEAGVWSALSWIRQALRRCVEAKLRGSWAKA